MIHEVDGIRCAVKKLRVPINSLPSMCTLCRKPNNGKTVHLFINNQEFFPNCIVHDSCVNELGGVQQAIRTLAYNYEKAVQYWPMQRS